jgi:hypothetical protein
MSVKVRPEQMEVFQPVAEAAFARRLTEYLRRAHSGLSVRIPPGATLISRIPAAVLTRMVQTGIERGRAYGLSWESSLASFVVIMFVAAPNFDEHPLVQLVLRDETMAPDRRIDGLWRRISNQNWKAVEAYYDPHAWGLGDQPG